VAPNHHHEKESTSSATDTAQTNSVRTRLASLHARPLHNHATSPTMMKGASTPAKHASISEFIKSSIDQHESFQALDTAATTAGSDTVATAVPDITDPSVLYRQAHVQFSKRIRVSRIIHLLEYTKEESEATWYQEKEYSRFSRNCINTVHEMEKSRKRSLSNREIESRGLEGHTTTGNISKTESRRLAYDKILHEQEHQRCLGIYDGEAMAESYQTVSSSCALWARKVALRDQIDAADYLDE
jgi:hypothetical protein